MERVLHGLHIYGPTVEIPVPMPFPFGVALNPGIQNFQMCNRCFGIKNVRVCDRCYGIKNHVEFNQNFIMDIFQRNYYPSSRRKNLKSFNDQELEAEMNKYVLTDKQLLNGGFPVDCDYPGCAVIWAAFDYRSPMLANLNPEAQEFVPGQFKDQLVSSSNAFLQEENKSLLLRKCKRCWSNYPVDITTWEHLSLEECVHHPGKFFYNAWRCCGAGAMDKGCSVSKCHVWSGVYPGCNGPIPGFVQTQPAGFLPSRNHGFGVYAMDSEMAFTKHGLTVIKLSVVALDGFVVYDEYIKPEDEILDYGTEIHGITEKEISEATKTLEDVHNDLLKFIYAESILLGHGLENDLRVMRIIHKRVIDTSYVFPHGKGFPRRYSLKTLAKSLLKKEIHQAEHDSIEDARVAMDVMLCKLESDFGVCV